MPQVISYNRPSDYICALMSHHVYQDIAKDDTLPYDSQ